MVQEAKFQAFSIAVGNLLFSNAGKVQKWQTKLQIADTVPIEQISSFFL